MKKLLIYLLIFVSLFSLGMSKVKAAGEKKTSYEEIEFLEDDGSIDCSGILTEDGIILIKDILGYLRILAPAILIVMVAVDFAGAVLASYDKASDPQALSTAASRAVKRAVAAVLLFLVPTLVRFALDLPGVRDAIQIPNDPLCGTMSSYPQETIEI